MNDFNGKGYPLEDERLKLSGTTPAGEQQYRIWHDSQMILVPKTQSTTKPQQPETVSCNTGVFSTIGQGYFKPPIVEFRNTVDYKLFDRFWLQSFRYDLPNVPHIDWHFDLGIKAVWLEYVIAFNCNGIKGFDRGMTLLYFKGINNWCSEELHFDNYGLSALSGDYFIVCNPTAIQQATGKNYTIGEDLQTQRLPLTVIVQRAKYRDGNSEMQLLVKNTDFQLSIESFEFTIKGGE